MTVGFLISCSGLCCPFRFLASWNEPDLLHSANIFYAVLSTIGQYEYTTQFDSIIDEFSADPNLKPQYLFPEQNICSGTVIVA